MRALPAAILLPLVLACAPRPAPSGAQGAARTAEPATLPQPSSPTAMPDASPAPSDPDPGPTDPRTQEVATFGAGCFWCVEAVLEQLDGVLDVSSGFMGGDVERPSYRAVCNGDTGHAEVVQVTFDPERISYDELLDWFWRLHDPTTLNRQGADVGTQYRSAIFVHSAAQRRKAELSRTAVAPEFDAPIVTEITDASTFWPAEDYHQDYYRQNKSQGYCRMVIRPKLQKLHLDD